MTRGAWLAVVLSGCVVDVGSQDPGAQGPVGSLEACAGEYRGSYDGADEGLAAATLSEDGVLNVLFTSDSGEVDAQGEVTEDGQVSGEEGSVSITGTFDFDNCTASGSWFSYGAPAGSWEISRR